MAKGQAAKRRAWNKGVEIGQKGALTPDQVRRIRQVLARRGNSGLRVRLKTSSGITKLSQHEADGCKFQERQSVAVEIFPVLGEATATVEPRDRAFDDPALG